MDILQTLQEMMKDRGETGWQLSENTDNVYIAGNTLIYLAKSEKFNIETMKNVIFQLQQHKMSHGLVVYQNIITSLAKKAIDHLQEFTIETFEKKELKYNPTHHRFYCPHTALSKEFIKKEIKTSLSSLPILLRSDVISRYFGFQKGQVIRIERKNGSIAYRLVK